MLTKFLSVYSFIKKLASSILLFSICLSRCTNVGSEYNMDMDNSQVSGGREESYVANSGNNKKAGNCCKYVRFTFLGVCIGAAIATAIEVPVYNSYLADECNSCFNALAKANSQESLFVSAIIPVLAENENTTYSLANGTSILGSSITTSNFNANDILSITSVDVSAYVIAGSNGTLFTAEQEFNLNGLLQVLPSIPGLQNLTLSNQYIGNFLDLTGTVLNSLYLPSTYLASSIVLPPSISTIGGLDSTVRCGDSAIMCVGGTVQAPNCVGEDMNNLLISFNQNIGSLCNDVTEYQQLLVNNTELESANNAYKDYLSFAGSNAYVYCLGNLTQINTSYISCTSSLAKTQTAYSTCTGSLSNYKGNLTVVSNNLQGLCNHNIWCQGVYGGGGTGGFNVSNCQSFNSQYPSTGNLFGCQYIFQNLPQYNVTNSNPSNPYININNIS